MRKATVGSTVFKRFDSTDRNGNGCALLKLPGSNSTEFKYEGRVSHCVYHLISEAIIANL